MIDAAQANKGRIEKRVLIKASPAIIFQALTDAGDLVRWFCDRATSDPRQGGELTAFWKSGRAGRKGRAIFTKFLPDSLLELLWVDDGEGDIQEKPDHILSYCIRSKHGTTEVIMRDEGEEPLDEEIMAIFDQGWNVTLFDLKDYCERKERSSRPRPAESLG